MWLSAGLAIAAMWGGLSIAYAAPQIPPSFGILAVATSSYLLAFAATAQRRRPARQAADHHRATSQSEVPR
jgi:zinc/manganese transport system permease protein